jgi:hypothetical protein
MTGMDRIRRRSVRFTRFGIVTGLLSLWTIGLATAQQHEQPTQRRAADLLAADIVSGPTYRVQDTVLGDGYMYRFIVDSQFGAFDVTGIGAVRKLVPEIRAIAVLRELKKGEEFGKAVKDSASGPIRFAKNLITNPVHTVSGLPNGAYKFMEEAGTAATSDRDPSDDPAYKQALLMSGRKREYAAQLGVDPYSSNAVLQKELNSIAWAAAAGNLTVSAALAPVGGGAGAALSGVRWSNALNDHLKNEPASRLRIINEGKLKAMGIPAELSKRYLDHKAFSPRHDTILVEALSRLGGARGREQFLEAALAAEDETDANFFTNMAQIMRGYHETVSPITAVQRVARRLVVAQTRGGTALVALPLDSLLWTEAVDKRSQEVKATYRPAGFNGKFDVWLTGSASPLAKQRLGERGMAVVEEVGKRVEIID